MPLLLTCHSMHIMGKRCQQQAGSSRKLHAAIAPAVPYDTHASELCQATPRHTPACLATPWSWPRRCCSWPGRVRSWHMPPSACPGGVLHCYPGGPAAQQQARRCSRCQCCRPWLGCTRLTPAELHVPASMHANSAGANRQGTPVAGRQGRQTGGHHCYRPAVRCQWLSRQQASPHLRALVQHDLHAVEQCGRCTAQLLLLLRGVQRCA